jgi:hypothetical protein
VNVFDCKSPVSPGICFTLPGMNRWMLFLLLLVSGKLHAQTQARWAQIVHWDGYSPWQTYMHFSPGFMGPNALPVPSMSNGGIDSVNYVGPAGSFFFSKGDNTQTLKFIGNYCLVKDLVSFDAAWIPVEWFQVDDATKDKRHVYWPNYYQKVANGDVFLNVNVRLLKKWDKHVQLAFRVGYRFPSSDVREVAAARYTDAPGYFFDVSAGKYLSPDQRWRLSGMAGFYVWQVTNFGQNDAFLFGGGLEYNANGWRWKLNGRGYTGWIGDGDFPILVSTSLEKQMKTFAIYLQLQQGLHDYGYTGVEFGTKYLFGKKSK